MKALDRFNTSTPSTPVLPELAWLPPVGRAEQHIVEREPDREVLVLVFGAIMKKGVSRCSRKCTRCVVVTLSAMSV